MSDSSSHNRFDNNEPKQTIQQCLDFALPVILIAGLVALLAIVRANKSRVMHQFSRKKHG
jgi:hypothetical protein